MKNLIIGNGFDLDLGLKTRYSDFAKSPQWTDLYESFNHAEENNLAGFLKEKAKEDEWFSIEKHLAEYVKEKISQGDFEHVSDDQWFFELLEEHLNTYLELESANIQEKDSLAKKILNLMNKEKIFDKIYTFNYIPHDALHEWCGFEYEKDISYVHQRLNCGIVLGVAENDITDDRYSFLRKVNHQSYQSTNLGNDLMKADEVVFFGHSLNTIDFDYFRDFFKACSKYNDVKQVDRHITIITKDERAILSIKNHLTTNGISVTLLNQYSHLSFVALDDYYRGDEVESDTINRLMSRLDGRMNTKKVKT